MAAVTDLIKSSFSAGRLRAFDVRRDLAQVADLVEQCFADTLDPDGQQYLYQMRAAARNPSYLRWATAVTERISLPLSGYVWEEDGRLVGNLTLIPFLAGTQRCYLIANVAVHPDYRRRGIARELTSAAIQHARNRGSPNTWLHVREENTPAIRLYEDLGFVERTRRTTWNTRTRQPPASAGPVSPVRSQPVPLNSLSAGLAVTPRRPWHWELQKHWLRQLYPPELTWHLSIRTWSLRPGLVGTFQRLFSNQSIQQWSAVHGEELWGVLAWQSTLSYADALWLATTPEHEEAAAYTLLTHALGRLASRRALALDYPAHRAEAAIQAAGFYPHQTLIWMQLKLKD